MKYIGVDIGGTNLVVGLVSEKGEIIEHMHQPTQREREGEIVFDDIIRMCEQIIAKYALDKQEKITIGMGIPGSIFVKEGVVAYSNNIQLEQFPARAYVQERIRLQHKGCRCQVFIRNDADCAALGEVLFGGAKDYQDVIMVTLGTGVGGGIIINGKIFSGFYPGGAEIGHQIIERNGRMCTCGNKGCLEAYASATALIKASWERAQLHPESLLFTMTQGEFKNMNAKIPFDAATLGDKEAIAVVEEYISYLAIGLTNMINIFTPQMILIGGGVSKQGEHLIKLLTKQIKTMVYGRRLVTKIAVATLGSDAGLIGAALLPQCDADEK